MVRWIPLLFWITIDRLMLFLLFGRVVVSITQSPVPFSIWLCTCSNLRANYSLVNMVSSLVLLVNCFDMNKAVSCFYWIISYASCRAFYYRQISMTFFVIKDRTVIYICLHSLHFHFFGELISWRSYQLSLFHTRKTECHFIKTST